jgi:arylsulfatase A-like enzyme
MGEVRNVVLITVDCLRLDHLRTYGYDRETAPFLTDVAEQSLVFENAFATGPGTFVSFPSIFTGTYPFDFGGYAKLSEQRTPIAEVISDQDIATAGVHSNTYLSRAFGYQRGFDIYETFYERPDHLVRMEQFVREFLDDDGLPFQLLKRVYEAVVDSSNNGGVSLPYEQADSTTDTVVDMLKRELSSPFFLWTHYMDVHAPHRPPDRHMEALGCTPPDWETHHESWLSAKHDPETATAEDISQFQNAYDAEIRFVDEQLSRLFEQMKRRGIHDETAYIITADHGELLGEHGQFSHPPRVYDELIHVPLMVHIPGVTDGTREDQLVSLLDLPSTIADLFDIPIPDTYQGESLCLLLTGDETPLHEYVFSEVCHRTGEGMEKGVYQLEDAIVACRSPTAKFVRDEQRDTELFERVTRNDSDANSEIPSEERNALRQAVEDHLAAITGHGPTETVDIDQRTAERLRNLGYAE